MKVYAQKINNLQQALSKLEDRVVLTSDKDTENRIYAISEIRYYKKLVESFFEYPPELKMDIVADLSDMIGVLEKWLAE